jgi:hypothetical protein
MRIVIEEFQERQIEAVLQFNERMRAGGVPAHFPVSTVSKWLPKLADRKIFVEYYLALDEEAVVRGAYVLKYQDYWIKDQVVRVGDIQLPMSEGAVDRRYSLLGVKLLRDALARQPLLYGLGMGSFKQPVSQLLQAAGWSMFAIPFFFRVMHPFAFLRNASFLRRRSIVRAAVDALALSGLGSIGIRAVQAFCRQMPLYPSIAVEQVPEFSDWADDLWNASKDQYGFSAVRDAETLRILYPKGNERFLRLKISEESRPIGWAVVLNTQLSNHNYFGNMRLGSIIDGFASTADAPKVVRAASQYLQSHNVDLIISNQSHAAWRLGFRRAGFLAGPSNFIFASCRKLTKMFRQNELRNDDLHINRGDGDGPINL